MRHSSPRRIVSACLIACALVASGPARADPARVVDYLTGASQDDAADYLAFLIRAYGCEVRREDRREFNEVILDFLAFDFGVELAALAGDGVRVVSEALREGLFAFSYRAGPALIERGELVIDRDGTARLTTCNPLTS
jgi:hypothetical protein